ncbi:SAM-dependent methyltransferase [Euzebya pacifica]|uniref:SAM-dependent methyltransferase n=1 Tax=Euzebya pacifica TaxID=1608957 RepID=A0A346XSW8_9ACTN|nr:class I SAM-dependent methyltransferase [Euzebya pacifica]AXV05315.1 SAM-dependent methyltransferase [Euzebya pacifica]
MTEQSGEHVAVNRDHWDDNAHEWVASGERNWAREAPVWGIWGIDNGEVPLLPDDLTGLDVVELGCGTVYGSAWMARRGARRVVGIDNSAGQLATATRLAQQHGIELELIHGDAEAVPLPDGSVDFALSEYGAAIWCDPYRWVPEAFRLLRPGGRLVFLGTHPLAHVTAPMDGSVPIDTTLHRGWFDLHRLDWTDAVDEPGGIEFCLPTAGWMALFRDVGFVVEDYREPRCPATGDEVTFAITPTWANRWPSEQAWWVRRP